MKDVIKMARESRLDVYGLGKDHLAFVAALQRFAELVRADERETCAKFCETHQVWVGKGKRGFSEWGEDEFVTGGIHQGMDYAAAIRNRGRA